MKFQVIGDLCETRTTLFLFSQHSWAVLGGNIISSSILRQTRNKLYMHMQTFTTIYALI